METTSTTTTATATKHHALSPTEFRPFKLIKREKLNNSHMHLFRFQYPEEGDDSGCETGQYLAVKARLPKTPNTTDHPSGEGGDCVQLEDCVRYYSPINSPHDNHVDLLIKIDDKGGKMSYFLRDMKLGDELFIEGPISGFKYRKNMVPHIGLIAGGAGISPMIQIIREITSNRTDDHTKISLLYGSPTLGELVLKEELDAKQQQDEKMHVTYTLDWIAESERDNWPGHVGYINEQMIMDNMPKPGPECLIVLCGPPGMIRATVALLNKLGYTSEMIYSYGG